MSSPPSAEAAHELRVADRYREQGYQVLLHPSAGALPFDLGSYQPDLIATRGDERLIIEVRSSGTHAPLDRLIDVAELVRAHPPWRFLLVTEEDVPADAGTLPDSEPPTWSALRDRLSEAEAIKRAGGHGAALLWTWSLLEGILRRRAFEAGLPLHRLPTSALIRQLYSLGELSATDYETLLPSLDSRNRLTHGFAVEEPDRAETILRDIAARLVEEWAGSGT